jgi:hypothetical protein
VHCHCYMSLAGVLKHPAKERNVVHGINSRNYLQPSQA